MFHDTSDQLIDAFTFPDPSKQRQDRMQPNPLTVDTSIAAAFPDLGTPPSASLPMMSAFNVVSPGRSRGFPDFLKCDQLAGVCTETGERYILRSQLILTLD